MSNASNIEKVTSTSDTYTKLSGINKDNQDQLNEIRTILSTLDKTEDLLRDKIKLRHQELDVINREYAGIIEAYNHIMQTSLK